MIRLDLKCGDGHGFDSWFASSAAFEDLSAQDRLVCPVCGNRQIEKALMAPQVQTGGRAEGAAQAALAALRDKIERHSDDVGSDFARQARAIHAGEMPQRMIHGEARVDEAKALVEEGVPVLPLPFVPKRKLQ